MIKASKNTITLSLILSSVALLLVLQVLWVKSAYRDAQDNFRSQTNILFRTTVMAMHDSLIQRNLLPAELDTAMKKKLPRGLRWAEGDMVFKRLPPADSSIKYINIAERTSRIEVIMSGDSKGDSLQKILRPLVTKMQADKEPKSFILKLTSDSLKVDSIKYFYQQALSGAGIDAPFKVLAVHNEPERERITKTTDHAGNVFISETVRLSPLSRYAVIFPDVEKLLLKEITPQILFSLFLTLLTIGSFYIIYRNLRAQQKLMEIKNDFISNITHELKTPVATVSVALEALKNFKALNDPQKTSEYLDIAQNELNRLTLMTDKILKTAVFEDKGVELKIEKIDVDTLIQQIVSSLKLVFEKKRINTFYNKEGTDFIIDASQAHLTNVFYNLMDNALKYSPEGATIEVTLTEKENDIQVSVKDTGIGIDPQYQKKIFEKFFRVPSGDVHNTKGYGLGLSYVSSVIKSHNGNIRVESEPGKGSNFIITIPKNHED